MGKTLSFGTSVSYHYELLQKKYMDFTTPVFELVVGTRELEQSKYYLSELEINIPVTAQSGLMRNEASS